MTTAVTRRLSPVHSAKLPSRYHEDWRRSFIEQVQDALRPGVRVLDVGSGREPTIPADMRPADCTYVGLDISESELKRAPAGSYDSFIVGDITDRHPELVGGFDLVVSWQVLEHVRSLDSSLNNAFEYTRPGGQLIAQFSGAYSMFGLINQVVPSSFGPFALKHLLGRDPGTVFPAHYHHCWHSKVEEIMQPWQETRIVPFYRGAGYLRFFRPLQIAYLKYEEWALRSGRKNLATHYLVHATR
jgi:SAM-dependent methyltransferase